MSASMYTHDDYTIGWICPLEVEHIAATEMLDEEHPSLLQQPADHNVYTLGSIHGHLVVIAGLPYPSNSAAAAVATQLRNTFPNMRSVLLVGIGGGVPTKTSSGILRLGDVVVSRPTGTHSGAVQYDHGKLRVGEFSRTGSLPPPPTVLLNADRHVAVRQARAQHDYLAREVERINTDIRGLRQFRHPGVGKDRLYRADYVHRQDGIPCDIAGCDKAYTISRDTDEYSDGDEGSFQSVVHRGTIACGELVIKDGVERDRLAKSENVLCFETEAAGALLGFPCLVIRGISDYADLHKNNEGHGYAAAVSAAYARLLLAHVPVEVMRESQLGPKGWSIRILHGEDFVACALLITMT